MKTICIYHSIDLDGWMSAAIVKYWFEQTYHKKYGYDLNKNTSVDLNNNYTKPENIIHFLGYNYGDNIPDLSECDKVIMCDISFPKEEMYKLFLQKSGNFIWIDHHISAIKDSEYESFKTNRFGTQNENLVSGLRDTNFAACELTWQYFFPNEPMPEIVRLLGRYDCFGSRGTDEEQKVLEFQYGARQSISNYEEAYKYLELSTNPRKGDATGIILENGKSIYQYLCTEAKQTYKNGFEINIGQSPIKLVDISTLPDLEPETLKNAPGTFLPYKFICINKERFNPINFGIDYHKDGYDGCACFHYDGVRKVWAFNLYNDNGEVDCSVIAKQFGGGRT